MPTKHAIFLSGLLAALACAGMPLGASLQAAAPAPLAPPTVTYADLADLADSAPLALRAQVRDLTPLKPEQARGVRAGWGRFYVEARTRALIAGNAVVGEKLAYLADLPLDARGRPPALRNKDVLIFARRSTGAAALPGKPTELQLVAPDAQLPWHSESEAKLRAILTELQDPAAPKKVRGVREVIHVPGNLAGEGETQMFLSTVDNSAASIVVQRKPGQEPQWGVTFSEVLGDSLQPPAPETLAWYRLACFMPQQLAPSVNLSATPADKAAANADYALVRSGLGACPRSRQPQ